MRKAILFILCVCYLASCTAPQKGFDYKTHHRKSANAKPSKCFKQHNQW